MKHRDIVLLSPCTEELSFVKKNECLNHLALSSASCMRKYFKLNARDTIKNAQTLTKQSLCVCVNLCNYVKFYLQILFYVPMTHDCVGIGVCTFLMYVCTKVHELDISNMMLGQNVLLALQH